MNFYYPLKPYQKNRGKIQFSIIQIYSSEN